MRLLIFWAISMGLFGALSMAVSSRAESGPGWAAFRIQQVDRERADQGRSYLEFFRAEDMSAGLYVLAAGAEDPQAPHSEDEVYSILEGKATLRVGDEDVAVEAGSVVYVKAQVPHRFHQIEEDLKVLVVFAPAFGTRQN